ncbi:hypothetical protein HGA89_02115, partial [bacterium]|nr:hypothetical protein [bacterium]
MIATLEGTLVRRGPDCLVEVGGLGLAVTVPAVRTPALFLTETVTVPSAASAEVANASSAIIATNATIILVFMALLLLVRMG